MRKLRSGYRSDGVCPRCNRNPRPPRTSGRLESYCYACTYDIQRARWAASGRTEEKKWTARLRRYGITRAEFDRLLEAQGGCCAICLGRVATMNRWHIDHDHTTGAVCGILCARCNTAIGHLDDSEVLISSALRYVRRTRRVVAVA